jgi:hypothetical protein
MRQWLLSLFKRASRPFWGKGINRVLPVVSQIYNFAYRCLSPSVTMLFEVHGLKIYAETKTCFAQILGMKGSYEEGQPSCSMRY